ncbi:MAG: winged helix-turn-helix domain-containing protein [Candidatus Bathyarchaeota archaeon]
MGTKDRNIRKLIEEGLGNAGRLKILRALASGETASQTKYGLEKVTGLSPTYVRKHLKVLMDTGWVNEYDYNPQVYTLNLDDPKARFLVDFFKKAGYLQT